ncbi:hypothetical protein O4160_03460 [Rhodococcus sp. IEGM 1401]|uniref:hypothetical protein n=1 Tax=unclassified Rhodococcus (in: high G+C Gram-positive bacteria) TaxID=192944 RepID=UPI0022B533D5|nr:MULTISPECIES: hypothetical protein [unclassified Rhodococcus (in: high G+C Gram-positive bacteria)]MCZ4559889.1 hypothetical protein [Rhodococcus sp. IEGM 1401]MDI9920067.1 hypothetical protein [Rhodococcus sp. IEGM 1372]MDV8032470.1 hypothetical protein [Rhodococcus sp. IEGM 1414]
MDHDAMQFIPATPGHSLVGLTLDADGPDQQPFALPVVMWAVTDLRDGTTDTGRSHYIDAVVLYRGSIWQAVDLDDDLVFVEGVFADTDVSEALNDLAPMSPEEAVAEALDPWAEKYNRPRTGQNR